MDNGFTPMNEDEVLFVDRGRVLMNNPTFKVSEFLDQLAQVISEQSDEWSEDSEAWFDEGLECEALRFNSGTGWQRGRVRIRLEFAPARQPERLPERSSARQPEPLTRLEPLSDRPRPRNIDDIYADEDNY
ncbi:KGK domain family protein [Leptolyngbya sp. NIES-3755]|nr:KGK domain family protein [Leptolyngbya sp. NIES-3755]